MSQALSQATYRLTPAQLQATNMDQDRAVTSVTVSCLY